MEHYFAPYQKEIELLDTIPGVGVTVAQVIIAEIGTDMSVFPSEAHISSWATVSPGNNESAGKKSTRTAKGNKALKTALLEAAWAASKTRTFLGAKFWSLAARKGKKKAATAIAHKIVVMIAYHILETGEPCNELGADFIEKRRSISTEELMIR